MCLCKTCHSTCLANSGFSNTDPKAPTVKLGDLLSLSSRYGTEKGIEQGLLRADSLVQIPEAHSPIWGTSPEVPPHGASSASGRVPGAALSRTLLSPAPPGSREWSVEEGSRPCQGWFPAPFSPSLHQQPEPVALQDKSGPDSGCSQPVPVSLTQRVTQPSR